MEQTPPPTPPRFTKIKFANTPSKPGAWIYRSVEEDKEYKASIKPRSRYFFLKDCIEA